ncbi:hypothetical protein FC67_GL000435 [Companilactobacillus alimentarius DSM 20249]|nr:hypothetical protein FC67_GL000435 [Companilactobacillus alimentarius DSM 20249]
MLKMTEISSDDYFEIVKKVWATGKFKDMGVTTGKKYIQMYDEFMRNVGSGQITEIEEKFHPDDCTLIASNDVDKGQMVIMCSQEKDGKTYLETFSAITDVDFTKMNPVESTFYHEMIQADTQKRIKEIEK